MFNRAGRRLAFLNALTVFLLIALLGVLAFIALRHSLWHELDRSLSERVEALDLPSEAQAYEQALAAADPSANAPQASSGDRAIASGDTLVIVYGLDGQVVSNPRGIQATGLPVVAGLDSAFTGRSDLRTVDLDGGETVRVLSVPVVLDGEVVGAAQAVRSTREVEEQLEDLGWIIAMGIVLALVVSVPAGLYLSSRAMQPINAAFDHQRQFVADASHELRTPMTLIRANTEMALLEAPAEARSIEPELRSVLREVDNTDRLISELMLIAQLDSGALRIERERLDLGVTVSEAAEDMRPLFDERGINLRCRTNGDIPAMLDAGRIAQVVRILLDNARKHTAPGGEVTVDVNRNGTAARISVSDTGSGIPAGHLERVFDRFYRVDRARSRQTGGAGLGLPIARAITLAHDGQISIQSEPGRGTTVLVTLPLAR